MKEFSIFIDTYQTMLMKNLLGYVTSNTNSKVLMFGDSGVGKSALLKNFTVNGSKDREKDYFYYVCSIYTAGCIKIFGRTLK